MRSVSCAILGLGALLSFATTKPEVATAASEDLIYLQKVSASVLESAKVPAGTRIPGGATNTCGSALHLPGGTQSYYPAFWIRDAAMMLGDGFIAPEEIAGWVRVIAATQPGRDGLRFGQLVVPAFSIPDHITLSGAACWFPGAYAEQGTGTYGFLPPADDAFYFIEMVHEHWRLTGALELFRSTVKTGWGEGRVSDVCTKAFSSVAVDALTGLVLCEAGAGRTRVDWGFCDTVRKSGLCLMPSLLRWQAAVHLSALLSADGNEPEARRLREAAVTIRNAIPATFLRQLPAGARPSESILLSATEVGQKDDVWASAYAVWLGVLPPDVELAVAQHLLSLYRDGRTVVEGQVRHLPMAGAYGGYWEQASCERDTYQNGGFWATPTGWLITALRKADPPAGEKLLAEYVAHLRQNQSAGAPWEWVNPTRQLRVNPRYGSSAAGVYIALTQSNPVRSEARPGSERPAARLDKAFVSFRIGVTQWLPEGRFRELLALFEKYKGVTDEITFFTSATHPPLPLEEVGRRSAILRERILQAKSRGYRAGINVLATIGHHNENLAHSLSNEDTRATDPDGNVCLGSFCPNDPDFQAYVSELYRLVASANPDYIWIDDDVRLAGHMPIGLTCFCERCLAIFEKESGVKFGRAALKNALFEGPLESRLALRKSWLNHNRGTISRLLSLVERTVHAERPAMPLGFMTGERFYEGYDFGRWAQVLEGPDHAPVYWRPGGGFYEDSSTSGLAGKSHEIGRQVSLLPPEVVSIQSEIENFPYQRLKKAARITVLEAASHMAAGCTGAAFNVLSGNDEPLDEFEPMLAAIHQARPFLDLLAQHLQRLPPVGLAAAWDKDSWAADLGMLSQTPAVLEIGLPAAYHPPDASVTLLFEPSVATMSDEEIRRLLSKGVYMDTAAVEALNRRGFGKLTGIALERSVAEDCIEELTSHSLNGAFAGRQRDCRQSFYHLPAQALKLTNPAAQSLGRLVDYAGQEKAAISMAVFENSLGGRIAVTGYFPWSFLHSQSKSAQMKSLMRWLSQDRLPAYVSSFHKVNLWARQPAQGDLRVVAVNSSFDSARDMEIALRTDCETVDVFDMKGQRQSVAASHFDGPYRQFKLPLIEPWDVRLIVPAKAFKE